MSTLPSLPAARESDASALIAGRYRRLEVLGRGTTATVYRAGDIKEKRLVAFKELRPELVGDEDLVRRFINEARAMAAVRHPNVLEVHDIGMNGDAPYMVLEYAPSGTLKVWVDKHGRMPPRMATSAMIQVSRGVGAVHRHGVVHRDIKPNNVLITHHHECRVADFGLARLDDAIKTETGLTMGTLGYMAPEQRFDAKDVDARADVYGIGATLYYLLTAERVIDLFRATKDRTQLLDAIPAALVDVVERCVFFNRDRRHASGDEVADALERALELLPPDSTSAPPLGELPARVASELREWPGELRIGTRDPTPMPEGARVQRIVTGTPMPPRRASPTGQPQKSLKPASDRSKPPREVEADVTIRKVPSGGWGPYLIGALAGVVAVSSVVLFFAKLGGFF